VQTAKNGFSEVAAFPSLYSLTKHLRTTHFGQPSLARKLPKSPKLSSGQFHYAKWYITYDFALTNGKREIVVIKMEIKMVKTEIMQKIL